MPALRRPVAVFSDPGRILTASEGNNFLPDRTLAKGALKLLFTRYTNILWY